MAQDFEIIDKSTAFQGYFRIDRYRFRHRLFGGGWSGEVVREVFERGHAVGVLPYDPERDSVVLIEQFASAPSPPASRPGRRRSSPASSTRARRRKRSPIARRKKKPAAR